MTEEQVLEEMVWEVKPTKTEKNRKRWRVLLGLSFCYAAYQTALLSESWYYFLKAEQVIGQITTAYDCRIDATSKECERQRDITNLSKYYYQKSADLSYKSDAIPCLVMEQLYSLTNHFCEVSGPVIRISRKGIMLFCTDPADSSPQL